MRKKRGRKPLPEDLPRLEVIHDLREEEKVCACGCELTKIGEEVSEKLDYIPAKLQVGQKLFGQIRSPGKACACSVVGTDGEAAIVEFDEPQFAPCSGQRLVLYDEDGLVVAGGTIDYTSSDEH